ncbi:hypothetical protein [Aquimarina mytili]|uniref:Uncharacterized protein n=1 Tax=Aquimarina mytili TaxID=874423 RepID=A0A936ZYD4_9FLAO|nr:hypothetical protein [Aquimarina mytili]MBL0684203.1 hypothetical protein [Aquimarina mytili]
MIITHNIAAYNILIFSNYAKGGGHQMGYIHLYGNNSKYLGYLGIIKDGEVLPQNIQHSNRILNIYFHESGLQHILDTLRNQSPISIRFNTSLNLGELIIGNLPVSKENLAA